VADGSSGTQASYFLTGSGAVPIGVFSHVAVTIQGTQATIYVNGVQVQGTYQHGVNGQIQPASQLTSNRASDHGTLTIGNGNGIPYTGLIDEVSIYNRALSAAEIGAIVAAGPAGKCKSGYPSCTYTFTPNSQSFGASGGVATFKVDTGPTCNSQPSTVYPWIDPYTIAGNGPRTVTYWVATNTGGARNGAVTVGGQQFGVSQAGTSCGATIQPNSASPDDTGGNVSVSVSVASGCHWTAVSHAPWITVKSGASGSGGGVVVLSVAPNTGGQRSGTATIAGQTFTVNQGGGACGALDITSKVQAFKSGVTWVGPSSWEYAQTVGVKNTSGAVIAGPVYFVTVGLPSSEQLPYTTYLYPPGLATTCFSANGDYLIPITYGSMSPGQSLSVQLGWSITQNVPVNYATKILSGTPSH
jgi:hypothetical protein